MAQKRSGTNKKIDCPYCGRSNSNVISEKDVPFIKGQSKSFIRKCMHCEEDISYSARYDVVIEASPIDGGRSPSKIIIN